MGSASCIRMKGAGLPRTVRPGLLRATFEASPLVRICACIMDIAVLQTLIAAQTAMVQALSPQLRIPSPCTMCQCQSHFGPGPPTAFRFSRVLSQRGQGEDHQSEEGLSDRVLRMVTDKPSPSQGIKGNLQPRTVERQRLLPRRQRWQRSRTASQMRCRRLLRRCQCQAKQPPQMASSSSTAPMAGQACPSAEPLPKGRYSVRSGERPSVSAVTSSACGAGQCRLRSRLMPGNIYFGPITDTSFY